MEKTLYEQMGGEYTQQGDYLLPNLTLPEKEDRSLGVWGKRRLRYLKKHHKVLYYNILTSGKLHSHLADIEEQAQKMAIRVARIYRKTPTVNVYEIDDNMALI